MTKRTLVGDELLSRALSFREIIEKTIYRHLFVVPCLVFSSVPRRFLRNLSNAVPRIRLSNHKGYAYPRQTYNFPKAFRTPLTITLSQKNPSEHRKASTEPTITFVYVQIRNCYEPASHVLSFIGPSRNPYVPTEAGSASAQEACFPRIP